MDFIDKLNSKIAFFFMYATLIITLVVTYGVGIRYFLRIADARVMFVSVWLYGMLFTLGGAYTLKEKGHVSVDILYKKFPPKVKRALDIFNLFLIIVCCLILLWVSIPVAWRSFVIREVDSSLGIIFAPPIWWFKWVAVISVFLMLLQAISLISKVMKGQFNEENLQEIEE